MLKKILGWAGGVVFALILIVVGSTALLVKQGWQFDAVLSGSMVPVFQVGGLAIFKPATAQDVKVGDIITFQYPDMNTPICHRIISIDQTPDGLVIHTKGDANNAPDEKAVTPSMVKGKNVGYLPWGGYAIDASNAGKTPIQLFNRSYPAAVLVVFIFGFSFIGLTMKETFESVFRPLKVRQKEIMKLRDARRSKLKKLYGLR